MSIPIEPMGQRLLVKISKRSHTAGGLVIADTAQGYDDVTVISRGPDAPDTYAEGTCIVLAPGTYIIELGEFPGFGMVNADQVAAIDHRSHEERLAMNPRLHLVGGAT